MLPSVSQKMQQEICRFGRRRDNPALTANWELLTAPDQHVVSLPNELLFGEGELIALLVNEHSVLPEFPQLHKHSCFELCFLHTGSCHLFFEDQQRCFEEGAVWLIRPGQPHRIRPDNMRTYLISIFIHPTAFSASLRSLLEPENIFFQYFLHAEHGGEVPPLLSLRIQQAELAELYLLYLLREYSQKTPCSKKVMLHLLCCLLIELSGERKAQQKQEEPPSSGLNIEEVLSYMQQHYASITLTELADHFHYSTRYLSDYLLQQTGERFSRLVNTMRLSQAKELLAHSEMSIERITHTVGYEYRSSFEASFKKEFHLTPKQYRRRMRGDCLAPVDAGLA